jgi:YD repeat-containing protein
LRDSQEGANSRDSRWGDTSGNTTTYTYDQLNRLTQAVQKNSGGTQLHNYQYGFDPASNMTSLTRDSTTITKTFNAANEMTQANTTTYSYDGNGNRTGDSSGTSIGYNTARQTTSITPAGGQTVTMAYAAQAGGGQSVDGGVLYQYDALGSSSAVQNGVTTYFTRASDGTLVSQRPSSGGTYYYLTDGEGSVVALTDSSGTMVDQYTYEPTGKQVISNGSVWNPYQWHQAQWDPAVQQYAWDYTHYDPSFAANADDFRFSSTYEEARYTYNVIWDIQNQLDRGASFADAISSVGLNSESDRPE